MDTRSDELNHIISDWAQNNNLKLNLAKSQEIIFVDKQRKHNFAVPSKLTEIQRVDVLKILGVTVITACRFHSIFKRSYHPVHKLCML